MDLEVQWASQRTIAAVERAGGRIRTAYYDPKSLEAAIDAKKWYCICYRIFMPYKDLANVLSFVGSNPVSLSLRDWRLPRL